MERLMKNASKIVAAQIKVANLFKKHFSGKELTKVGNLSDKR